MYELKEDQHYISKFILKKFVNPKSKSFKVFDKKRSLYLSGPKYPPKTMMKKFFYEHSSFSLNEIEDLLASRETVYAPIIDKLIKGKVITKGEFRSLLEFRHVTYYRSSEFIAFLTYQKQRGENSWLQRADWRMINGITSSEDDAKRSQLSAIKRTIAGTEPILELSVMTPVCFVLKTSNKRFVIGDNGSISLGAELDGLIVIVVSPWVALMFPRTLKATEMMKQHTVKLYDCLLLFEDIKDDVVDLINKRTKEQAYAYWVESA